MTELELISGKPKIFAISSDEESLALLKEFVEDYGYEFAGSAFAKEDIFDKLDKISPNLIFLDTDIENIDLEELAGDLEIFNVPILLVIGALFDETIDKLLTNNPYGFLLKPLEDGEVQRSMAVALKKHEQNIINVKTAQAKIKEKSTELVIEKSDSSFLLILCIALILTAILSRNATWLQWVLLIPSLTMLLNSLISLKKMKPITPYKEEDLPFISIFIPAHNEENTIEATVRSVCQSEYMKNGEPNYEVIVINDGSTDSTGEILANLKKELPQIKIVSRHPPRSGKGKGFVLNDALTLSRGEVIGVFDADTQIKTDFLMTIVQYLNGDIDGVQSRVKMFNRDENYLARMQHLEFASFGNTLIAKDNMASTGFLGGNGQFVKKDAIINCGRWDGFAVTEDLNLAIKIILQGGKIRYCGECAVYQEAVEDWRAFFRQRIRWAIGNFETLFIYFHQIIKGNIPILKKFNILEHISFYSFNLLIFFGFIVTIINAISWFMFHGATIIRMEAPFLVGFLSVVAFFPGIIIALSRDKPSIQELIKDIVKYYIYCFHLIPLFFLTMQSMISRKERRWSKTVHKGGKK
ncbi:MAG: glycosyltransferase [Methanobrevibacter thaueri]|jgi:1,2-diacylglycerol 3-beta-glucosyltransferase|uniref:Glycosyltransferase n=1 Tax=Methanobrevibacter thaueri TaxID=190975 RepID=A0A8T3V9A6_9EURY|nr:glycosyltransferase [Methanobrevibacter thaueri]MBE6501419.1 glycosyltransferase [Methanobrevibacter thaueri]